MQVSALIDEVDRRFNVRVADGLQLLTPAGVLRRPFEPGLATVLIGDDQAAGGERDERTAADEDFDPPSLPGRGAHADEVTHMLRALYPADHPIAGLAGAADTTVGRATDAEITGGAHFLAGVAALANTASPHALPWLVARLRAPNGCPWDREQDHLSLRKFLLEETYEVYDALERGSTPALAEELGDLLLQIVLHAQYAAEAGVFDLTDVNRHIVTKIVRRHPHVFGDVVADSAAEVIRNWEQIKAGERAQRSAEGAVSEPRNDSVPQAFAGLSKSLPSLAYAQEMQERAASLGYDWPSVEGVLDKVTEEAREFVSAADDRERREEFGDLLMVLVNLARKSGIDAEAALRAASAKFAKRFADVERQAAARDVELRALSFEELDELWDRAKVATR